MQVRVEGLEDHIERIVTEKVAAALSGHAAADRPGLPALRRYRRPRLGC
jgi:hypothetical protein